MTAGAEWRTLAEELDRWADAGRTAEFWLRDDDAVEPSPPLERLLGLAGRFSVPLTLAVIPASTGKALALRLAAAQNVAVAVHGWSHADHAAPGEKKQELGPHRPASEVLADLERGLAKLRALHAALFTPVLVPPWNRIEETLLAELPALGFAALSTFGSSKPAPLRIVNATVDIVDWRGGRCCRPHAALVDEIVRQLRSGLGLPGRPVGVMTHHLVHDDDAWIFLSRLFEETSRRGGRWRSMPDLLCDDAPEITVG
jgi:peptidoglycan/xylan/chitin deacetylase (PgdA/CDA1 family)